MLIFRPDIAHRVLAGEVTQWRARRRKGDNLGLSRRRPGGRYSIHAADPTWRKPGEGIGHVIVTHVRRQRLGDLSDTDVEAMGYTDRGDFDADWVQRYRDGIADEHGVVADPDEDVWVVNFVLDRSQEPRLLADRRRAANHEDYTSGTSMAIADAGEAVPEQVQEQFSMEGDQQRAARLANYEKQVRDRPLSDRLRELEAIHEQHGDILLREMQAIRRRIDQAERRAIKRGSPPRAA